MSGALISPILSATGWADTESTLPQADILAHPPELNPVTLDYHVIDLGLPEFLKVLANDAGMRLEMTAAVRGQIAMSRLTGSADQILDRIADRHDLDWFAFNGVHYVAARHEAKTRLVRLGKLPYDRAKAALEDAGLVASRFPIRPAASGTAMALSGPPKLLGIAEAVIESTPDPSAPSAAAEVRIRRAGKLNYVEPTTPQAAAEASGDG